MDPKIYHYSFSNVLYILLFYYVLKVYTSLYIFLLHVNKSYKKKFRCLLNFFKCMYSRKWFYIITSNKTPTVHTFYIAKHVVSNNTFQLFYVYIYIHVDLF